MTNDDEGPEPWPRDTDANDVQWRFNVRAGVIQWYNVPSQRWQSDLGALVITGERCRMFNALFTLYWRKRSRYGV